ncbi:periplasmic heavy metal sensor [Sphingomonas sp. CARO-RG-8B-R24-01]|uniref:periplasmic heavy metal sensor n=1 Tax=Sphingomonas sp. CARO-RG-8B-R24-01 TaxID=2914831 RepID=UPI001F562DEC
MASLLLNLFLAGALIGGTVWLRGGHRMIAAGALRVIGSELPRDERRAFRANLREARASVRPLIVHSSTAKAEAARLLGEPTPDSTSIKASLAQARADDIRVRAMVENRAVDFAATLPQADRRRIADSLVGRIQRRDR